MNTEAKQVSPEIMAKIKARRTLEKVVPEVTAGADSAEDGRRLELVWVGSKAVDETARRESGSATVRSSRGA